MRQARQLWIRSAVRTAGAVSKHGRKPAAALTQGLRRRDRAACRGHTGEVSARSKARRRVKAAGESVMLSSCVWMRQDTVNYPVHIKNFNLAQLRQLCKELRSDIIHTVSKTGGECIA